MDTVLITGANRGIGLGLVKVFLRQEYQVIATYRDESASQELIELALQKNQLSLYPLDVTHDQDIDKLRESLLERNVTLGLLINNAGVMGEVTPDLNLRDDLRQVLEVNTVSVLSLTEKLFSLLAKDANARVINISSLLGSIEKVPQLHDRGYSYPISKAALNMLTSLLAVRYKKAGVTVVSLSPGWVQTDMGGPEGDLTVEESVEKMFHAIKSLTLSDSGKFFHYDGTELPW